MPPSERPGFERDPDEIKPVSQESKDLFLLLIDEITETSQFDDTGYRGETFILGDGHFVQAFYVPQSSEYSHQDDRLGYVEFTEEQILPDQTIEKSKRYILKKDGTFERMDKEEVVDTDEEERAATLFTKAYDEPLSLEEEEEALELADAESARIESNKISHQEARQLGLTNVTEAEIKPILEQMKKLLEQKRAKNNQAKS